MQVVWIRHLSHSAAHSSAVLFYLVLSWQSWQWSTMHWKKTWPSKGIVEGLLLSQPLQCMTIQSCTMSYITCLQCFAAVNSLDDWAADLYSREHIVIHSASKFYSWVRLYFMYVAVFVTRPSSDAIQHFNTTMATHTCLNPHTSLSYGWLAFCSSSYLSMEI